MTEPLLQTHLEPVAHRQRQWRRARGLALGWAGCALVGLLRWGGRESLGDAFRFAFPALVAGAVLATAIIWRRHSRWRPDYRNIARQIERNHPQLHALLLTAIEQRPDPATG